MIDVAGHGLTVGLLASALLFGLRHGIDWDHIAAITDIAATQENPRRGFRLGTVYVLGHAAVVFVLGMAVIMFGSTLPSWIDEAMGKVVGWTLLLLGIWVIFALIRDRGEFRMRSRWMLLFAGARRVRRFVSTRLAAATLTHDHPHAAVDEVHHSDGSGAGEGGSRLRAPTHRHAHSHDIGESEYGTAAVAGIGMLHGIGAETPTQLVIFLAAAQAGGMATGIAVLAVFILGLIISNSAITLTSTLGFRATESRRRFHTVLGGATAVVSLVIGAMLIAGAENGLPLFFAG